MCGFVLVRPSPPRSRGRQRRKLSRTGLPPRAARAETPARSHPRPPAAAIVPRAPPYPPRGLGRRRPLPTLAQRAAPGPERGGGRWGGARRGRRDSLQQRAARTLFQISLIPAPPAPCASSGGAAAAAAAAMRPAPAPPCRPPTPPPAAPATHSGPPAPPAPLPLPPRRAPPPATHPFPHTYPALPPRARPPRRAAAGASQQVSCQRHARGSDTHQPAAAAATIFPPPAAPGALRGRASPAEGSRAAPRRGGWGRAGGREVARRQVPAAAAAGLGDHVGE